ncbi:MAG TPA: tyrosinase family protein [Longimicrobium sp.]|nr:tyrosinase family protein [Longimicrobium sp.]
MVYVRKDWNALTQPERDAYAKGVGAMRDLAASDPTDPRGWLYQANVHGDPDGDPPPAQQRFWAMCQHASWYFLPWHRMYIYFFERIVRKYSGNPDFALPYWNYTDTPGIASTRALPADFRDTGSSLYTPERRPEINAGAAMPESNVLYSGAYENTSFFTYQGGTRFNPLALAFGGFAGEPSHDGYWTGLIENQPHNLVHVAVGGTDGLMSNPDVAARDPIFWLHHSNIDRMWEGWLALGGGRHNPEVTGIVVARFYSTRFYFHDENGNEVVMQGSEILDTVGQLDYAYDKLPPAPPSRQANRRLSVALAPAAGDESSPPSAPEGRELGVAEETGFRLDAVKLVRLALSGDAPRRGLFLDAAEETGEAESRPMLLTLEGVRVEGLPGYTYEVYLNVPDLEHATFDSIHYVGNFGIFTHPGGGAHAGHAGHAGHDASNFAFDVTGVVADLRAQDRWDPESPNVTFVARGVEPVTDTRGRAPILSAAERGPDTEMVDGQRPPHYTVERVRLIGA